jgi:hypothetical protein
MVSIPTADLTKPSATPGWMIGAFFAALLLMGVVAVATWAFALIKSKTSGITSAASSKITGAGSGSTQQFYLQ